MKFQTRLRHYFLKHLGVTVPILHKVRIDYPLIFRYVSKIIGPNGIYVEVGACTGLSAENFCRVASLKPKNCYLIEACPDNFEIMRKRMQDYNLFNLAISNKVGELPFYVYNNPNEPGSSRSNTLNKSSLQKKMPNVDIIEIKVPTITLDKFFEDNSISWCDYLFINCEGAEYQIFSGDCNFLKKVHLLYIDMHKGLYGTAKCREEMIDIKLNIFDMITKNGLTRIAGYEREDINNYNRHLSFLFEKDN